MQLWCTLVEHSPNKISTHIEIFLMCRAEFRFGETTPVKDFLF